MLNISFRVVSYMTGAATFGTGMGERVFARVFVTSYQGQLSLAIPPCVGAMRSGDGCGNHKGKTASSAYQHVLLPVLLEY